MDIPASASLADLQYYLSHPKVTSRHMADKDAQKTIEQKIKADKDAQKTIEQKINQNPALDPRWCKKEFNNPKKCMDASDQYNTYRYKRGLPPRVFNTIGCLSECHGGSREWKDDCLSSCATKMAKWHLDSLQGDLKFSNVRSLCSLYKGQCKPVTTWQ